MLVVAGISLKNLKPRVWDSESPDFLPDLRAVMVSWAEIAGMPAVQRKVAKHGLKGYLGIPETTQVYLDNGSFHFLSREEAFSADAYTAFASDANPDWKPVPRDVIPSPGMTPGEQRVCFERTMEFNLAYRDDGYVPVAHISLLLDEYKE